MINQALRRELIAGAAVIGGSLLAFFIFMFWLSRDLDLQVEGIARARLIIRASAQSFERLADLQRGASSAARSAEELSALLPPKDDLFEFPRALDTVARIHNVTLSFSFQGATAAPANGAPGSTGFGIEARGTAEAVTSFLREVEMKSRQFLLTLGAVNVGRDGAGYRVSAQGTVFFR